MIPDWETNRVYVSGLLPGRYPKLWQQLSKILRKHHVPASLIDGTRDVWARDYCPIQIGPRQFIKFRYCPDYLKNGCEHLVTPGTVCRHFQDLGTCRRSNIILDGGNVVVSKRRVVLTEKLYRENPQYERFRLRSKLTKCFEVDHCIVVPKEPGDVIGHSDGLLRFLEEGLVIVNDYSRVDPAYGKRLRGILAKEGLRIEKIAHFREDRAEDGISSAVGNYVNFLRIGNLIVVPAYKAPQDDRACKTLERLCPHATVVPLLCKDLARAGGVLNCIGYTVRARRLPHD